MQLIPNWMSSRQRLIDFLVSAVIFLAKYLTAFLIVEIFMDGYMLIASTDVVFNLSLFTFNSSSLYFRLEALIPMSLVPFNKMNASQLHNQNHHSDFDSERQSYA